MDPADEFEVERPRLEAIASRVLGDPVEAQDVVQQAWLRLNGTDVEIASLPAWLTTVTTRLCLDRLRSRIPVPVDDVGPAETVHDPAEGVALAETVGLALHVVLDRLSPQERIAFVLHDSFGFDFPTIAALLDTTPGAARKLASRARAKVSQPRHVCVPYGLGLFNLEPRRLPAGQQLRTGPRWGDDPPPGPQVVSWRTAKAPALVALTDSQVSVPSCWGVERLRPVPSPS